MQETIDHLNSELEESHSSMLDLTNRYEDQISKIETQSAKKDKDNKLQKNTIASLKYEIETLKKKIEIIGEEGEIRETKAYEKNEEL